MLNKDNFERELDQDENVMGVGNGVLEFDKVAHLVESYHHHKVMRFSCVNYVPINPDNPDVQIIFKSIWDSFPVGEKDAFHWTMFFLSTSLTGRMKAALFYTLRGNGANGKSYLMEMARNVLGSVNDRGYASKLPVTWLIEREKDSNAASPVLLSLIHI